MFKLSARSTASVTEWRVENADGIMIPVTFSLPNASAANAATTAESIPPESPNTAFCIPAFLKKERRDATKR